jgi:hypothetical protein
MLEMPEPKGLGGVEANKICQESLGWKCLHRQLLGASLPRTQSCDHPQDLEDQVSEARAETQWEAQMDLSSLQVSIDAPIWVTFWEKKGHAKAAAQEPGTS